MKLQNSEITEFHSYYKLPWIGTSLAKDQKKTSLLVHTQLQKLTIFFDFANRGNSSFLEISPPRGNIFNFCCTKSDTLFLATKQGYLYFYRIYEPQRKAKILSTKYIKSLVSASTVCHLGSHVAVATANNFGKLEKIFLWKLTENFEFVLPRMMTFRSSPLSHAPNSYFNSLRLGYLAGNVIIIGCQLLGKNALTVYTATQAKLVPLQERQNFTKGIFQKFGFFRETTWLTDSTGLVKRIMFEI
jgi:hypothetical protein